MRSSSLHCAYHALAIVAGLTSVSVADETLRWKFNAGEKLNFFMSQDMVMDAGPSFKMGRQQTMDTTWDVKKVDGHGNAVVEHTIDRIQVRMFGPGEQSFQFDSDSEEPAVGMAAMVAPTYEAMTNVVTEFTISPRAEVSDVKLSPKLLEAMAKSLGGQEMTEARSAEQFKQMISQVAIALPEKALAKGDAWNTTLKVTNPGASSETVDTIYTYDGVRQINGSDFAVIKPKLTMNVAIGAGAQMNLKEQSTTGELLFDLQSGRLHSLKIDQDVALEFVAGEQRVPGTIDQKIEVKVTPAADKPAATESPATEPAAAAPAK